MPIYAYRCQSCGHAKDVLQKVSDPQLSTCPACGADAFRKQLTAAGFQLKGSGWYVTDFRGGNGAAKANAPADGDKGAAAPAEPAKPAGATSGTPAKAAGGDTAGTAAGTS
jgi:putative FmdB family regulatory protein